MPFKNWMPTAPTLKTLCQLCLLCWLCPNTRELLVCSSKKWTWRCHLAVLQASIWSRAMIAFILSGQIYMLLLWCICEKYLVRRKEWIWKFQSRRCSDLREANSPAGAPINTAAISKHLLKLDSISVSVFEVILFEFDKYWIWVW